MLSEIQNGTYARNWIEENETGRPTFTQQRKAEQGQLIEQVGARLRGMMPFVKPKAVTEDGAVVDALQPAAKS